MGKIRQRVSFSGEKQLLRRGGYCLRISSTRLNDGGGCVSFCGGRSLRLGDTHYCVRRGECGPSAAEVVRMVGLLPGSCGASRFASRRIILGLKNCRRTVMFFRRTMRSLLLIGRPTAAGLLFDGRRPRLRKDKNVTLPTGGTAGIFGRFLAR